MKNNTADLVVTAGRHVLSLCICFSGIVAAPPVKILEVSMDRNAERRTIESAPPHWDKGYLVGFNRGLAASFVPTVWMEDTHGTILINGASVWFPDADHVTVSAVAVSNDRALLIAAEVWKRSGEMARVLCHMRPPGTIDIVIRTDSFLAEALLVRPDGIIWGFGNKNPDPGNDYDGLERYDSTGHLLSSHLRRSEFDPDLDPHVRAPFGWTGELGEASFAGSDDRVGVLLPEAKSWIEFDASGNQIDKFHVEPPAIREKNDPVPSYYTADDIGMTRSGRVYAFFYHPGEQKAGAPPVGLYQLDRIGHKWVPLPESFYDPDYTRMIFGIDGEMVILRSGCCRYGWFPLPDVLTSSNK
jgi:hypothetical protein